jgi:hypothetical protein
MNILQAVEKFKANDQEQIDLKLANSVIEHTCSDIKQGFPDLNIEKNELDNKDSFMNQGFTQVNVFCINNIDEKNNLIIFPIS